MTIKETIEEAKKVGVKDMSWKAWFMIITIISAATVASYYGVNVTMNIDLANRVGSLEGMLSHTINSTFYALQKQASYIVSVVTSGATTYYCMQNGTTGALDFWSTNATVLMQNVFDNMSLTGGVLYQKRGVYVYTGDLCIIAGNNAPMIWVGEGPWTSEYAADASNGTVNVFNGGHFFSNRTSWGPYWQIRDMGFVINGTYTSSYSGCWYLPYVLFNMENVKISCEATVPNSSYFISFPSTGPPCLPPVWRSVYWYDERKSGNYTYLLRANTENGLYENMGITVNPAATYGGQPLAQLRMFYIKSSGSSTTTFHNFNMYLATGYVSGTVEYDTQFWIEGNITLDNVQFLPASKIYTAHIAASSATSMVNVIRCMANEAGADMTPTLSVATFYRDSSVSHSYTLPYSYTIYKSGSNYVMEKYDGTTWSSTNASSVFNNAAGNLTSGRSWIEWIKVQGNFTLTSPVLVSGYTGFDLRGSRLWLGANIADGAMFESASFGTARSDWTYFLGGWLDGVKATYTGGSGIRGDFRHSRFEGMTITAFPEYGVCIEGYSGINADADQFVNDWIGVTASNTGNKLGGLFFKNSGGTSNDHQITNCFLINNGAFQAAIQGASGTTKFSNVHFAGNPPVSENPSVSLWLNGSTSRVQVENCHFEYSDYESILVNNTSYAEQLIFTGNTFTQSNQDATANNTRSTIFLDSTSGGIKNVIIAENTFASSLSYKAQYAINIGAGTENVDVHDNSIRTTTYPAYFTAPIINSGGSTNKFLNNMGFVTENWVSGANTTATTIVISHNLAGTPQYVFASFNFTGWTSWTWTATSTQITITVTGTLPASYTAYAHTKYNP